MKRTWIITSWLIIALTAAYIISPINSSLPAENSQEAIEEYIQFTESSRVMAQRELDHKIKILFDRRDTIGGRPFEVYQLGVDIKEEDGSDPRFVNIAWLYWDAKKLQLFEQDMVTEEIRYAMPWREN